MEALKNGIELTGTLFTSAQGEAKDKLAYAEQIWDNDLKQYQSDINKKRASLGEDNKILVSQLPSFKTINGKSIVGEGNIELDITLFRIVSSLPTTNIEANKIYLVLYEKGQEGNIYAEYVYVDGKWEELGKFQTQLDLSDYALKTEIPTKVSQLTNDSGFLTEHQDISGKVDKVEGKGLSTNDYTNSDKTKLDSIQENAEENQNAYTSIVIHNKDGRDQVASATNKKCIFTLNAGKYLDGQVVGTNNLGLNVNIPFASTENEGLMSADDKSKVDNIDSKADISDLPNVVYEEIANSENAPEISEVSKEELKKDLFIDMWKTKGGPNKVSDYNEETKLFKLYDIDDINYEEALRIYMLSGTPYITLKEMKYVYFSVNNLMSYIKVRALFPIGLIHANTTNMFYSNRYLEVLCFTGPHDLASINNLTNTFAACTNLRRIIGKVKLNDIGKNTFAGCQALEEISLHDLRNSISFVDSPLLSLASLQYLVQYASNSNPITITVHPDVYAKIIDETNTEWNQLLTDAAAKNITFTTTE